LEAIAVLDEYYRRAQAGIFRPFSTDRRRTGTDRPLNHPCLIDWARDENFHAKALA
jgi:hypothetical protein